ncbi:MAG: type I-B CRISPR-associated protein Cas7/Cst2/DevR [Candidatus Melainabacteria bacterium]|nr:type I-B CRISPR-associated protein Cas7/Cst2/DevR [Candidatus Melainabacteria bacterium]
MFINIFYIAKVNLASLNGSEGTGGNITPIKKVSDFKGNQFAYVSGQALRRYLKETLMQLGAIISGVDESGEPFGLEFDQDIFDRKAGKIKDKKVLFEKLVDLDLFGYMLPKGGRRWSPVKVSPLISIYPYKGEYDYLTRKKRVESEAPKTGNIVQVEIDTFNYMRGNIIIDCSKIGVDIDEYTYGREEMLSKSEIASRINLLIDAIKNLNGGAKSSRNLEDISPQFVVAVRQKSANPFLLNCFSNYEKNHTFKAENVLNLLNEHKDITEKVSIGLNGHIFDDNFDLLNHNGYHISSPRQALDAMKILDDEINKI